MGLLGSLGRSEPGAHGWGWLGRRLQLSTETCLKARAAADRAGKQAGERAGGRVRT